MPFLDHLEELRWRLLWCVLAIALGALVGWFVVDHFNVLGVLIRPLHEVEGFRGRLVYTGPYEPFFLTLKLALLVGFVLAFPVIVFQIWSFLSPALLPSERRVIMPALYLGFALFTGGVVMAYRLVLPMTLKFTMGFQTAALEQMLTAEKYLSAVTRLLLAFGVAFELPVVIMILAALGVVTPEFLAAKRRHAFVGITVLAAVLTPGDVLTVTVMMMVPLFLLYELSIVLSRLVTRKELPVTLGAEG